MKRMFGVLTVVLIGMSQVTVEAQWNTNGTHIYSTNSGNVGIGTNSPAGAWGEKLHIFSTSNTGLRIERGSGAFGSFLAYSDQVLLGSGSSHPLHLMTGGTARLSIGATGNVGIGTTNPLNGSLEIRSTADSPLLYIRQARNVGGSGTVFFFRDDRGYSGDNNGTTFLLESWKGLNNQGGTLVNFQTIDNGFYKSRFYISNHNGNVGIGTTSPDAQLTVKGTVHSEEVKVDLNVPAPDYVFGEDYELLSLSEVAAYIRQNEHLPEIPSAKAMEENGVNLGEMNMLLLKKVEELTLYAIEQQKEIQDLKEEVNILKTTHKK